ncbi:Gfo/Idh/MocA family protein [Alicyclobacillus dauci]|uniref:Gfo/Idh/MocA family oxidoreductase n=1 Tax=Alicyclobacillus dauci TaxID=1475485 RepID=A0ABY6Z7I2_9BACL|nr:Gfo/Idh/MocA family oxidoreductase [Alicyclobacillus dauci]WAH37970.1 Gfo/Idh/MocA family oxidoreductase [Alicyclobacillus dauci]
MSKKVIRFGVIGCGLMGKEFASAVSRWIHLEGLDFIPRIEAVCDKNIDATGWFADNIPTVRLVTSDYNDVLNDPDIDAVYCAVPHNLHARMYVDIISSGKHLLGEKPFGIDKAANDKILAAISANPGVLVRCSSEFPFYPGAYKLSQWIREEKFGKIIDVEAGFWHSSDLDPNKPINWKRQIEFNGEYGCMGDLGLHVLHVPLRYGWRPQNIRAVLSNIIEERPGLHGNLVPCETWDNATLACEVEVKGHKFPMTLSMKRIAPGHSNTWFLKVRGTKMSAEFTTKNSKQLSYLVYQSGDEQSWRTYDVPNVSAYKTISGNIFEFGFSDSILQMWAAFCDELAHGDKMSQPFQCVRPEEAAFSHTVFTAALESYREGKTIFL